MAAKTQKSKLLIIDDEEPIRSLLIDLLGGDYNCSEAGSAEEALTALADETFDLVISDIDMGGMSGLELVPRVHSLSPDTVVVMISGNSDIEFAIEALRVGAFDYISKPIDIRHVEASVERALNHNELLKEKRTLQRTTRISPPAANLLRHHHPTSQSRAV
jgi:two-component system NtrC family response regulator/two-component system response regulator HydG/two-component system response regulator AtoC